MNRRTTAFFSFVLFAAPGQIRAQGIPDLPSPPTAFETRNTGRSTEGEAISIRKEKITKKTVSYIAVTELRTWTNTEGVSIRANLLAFEQGKPASTTDPLTLIREGKVRLLVEGKKEVSDLPLAKLSKEDQTFIKGLDEARKKAASKTKPKSANESG